MEQLLLHLIGDYILQTNWMAREKIRRSLAAAVHVTLYVLPFVLLTQSVTALAVMWVSHFLIDRFRLARHLIFAKNWVTEPSLTWQDCSRTGYPSELPAWLSVWLMIVTDNTLHLVTNYAAIRWL